MAAPSSVSIIPYHVQFVRFIVAVIRIFKQYLLANLASTDIFNSSSIKQQIIVIRIH